MPPDDHRGPSRSRTLLAVLLPILVGVLLHAPSLWWDFYADDFGQQLVLAGEIEHPTMKPWNLYAFGDTPGPGSPVYEVGSFPWWTSSDWKISFVRPLPSASLMLDHAVFGRSPVGYHATSLIWFAAALALAFALYRAAGLARGPCVLALWILALNGVSLLPVGWIANRNALLEAVFALAALYALAGAGPRPGAGRVAAALAASACALLSKESGIAVPLVCSVLCWRRGARGAAATFAGLALGYVAWFVAAGNGSHSLFYPTPWGDPGGFLRNLAVLLVPGMLALVLQAPIDLLTMHPEATLPVLAVSLALFVPFARAVARGVRTWPAAWSFAMFGLFALAPQAGSPPSERLYYVPLFGFAPLLALFLADSLGRLRRGLVPASQRRIAWVAAVFLLGVAGPWLLLRCVAFREIIAEANSMMREAEIGPATGGRREVVLLQVPSGIPALAPLTQYRFDGGDPSTRIWDLQMGQRRLVWRRSGERTFQFESFGEPLLDLLFERVFLTRSAFPAEGWRTAAFQVRALTTPEEGLTEIELEFPPDADEIVFLTWRDGRLRRVEPPEIGGLVRIPRAERLSPLMP